MTSQVATSSLDKFARSRAALMLACAWGLAEATLFFIVPDVLLTLIACRGLRPALKGTIAALAGALVGGAIMFALGSREADAARILLDHVPAISPTLIERVSSQVSEKGLLAVLIGPARGIPYKIYAVEWGLRHGSLIAFILISIPARYVRFFLASLAARAIARLIEPVTHHRATLEASILLLVWVAFYTFYFASFDW